MPLESGVKFRSPQNISGGSQQNSDAAFCQTTEVDGDLFYHKMAPYSNPSPQKPRNNRVNWKHVIYTFFKAEIVTVAAKLKVLACIMNKGRCSMILADYMLELFFSSFAIC